MTNKLTPEEEFELLNPPLEPEGPAPVVFGVLFVALIVGALFASYSRPAADPLRQAPVGAKAVEYGVKLTLTEMLALTTLVGNVIFPGSGKSFDLDAAKLAYAKLVNSRRV